jgi:hypothetical protein
VSPRQIPAVPRAPFPRGGGDTLAIWRWQGKAGRIKALMASRGQPDLIRSRPRHRETLNRIRLPAADASRHCRFITLPSALRGSGGIVSGSLWSDSRSAHQARRRAVRGTENNR